MQTAQIQVKYINPPKGRGPASVKDATGKLWKFWTRDVPLEKFRENQSYTVGYKTEPYNGQDQFYIEEVLPDNVTALPSAAAPRTAPNGNGHANGNGDRERAIYEQALLKCFIDAGKVELSADAITGAIIAIQTAYDRTR